MNEWKLKVFGILTIILIVLALNLKLFHFSAIVQQGEFKTLVCLRRAIKVDTSAEVDQILTFQILSGQFRGETVQVNNVWAGRPFGDRILHKGDVLFLEIPLKHPNQTKIEEARMLEDFRAPFLLDLTGLLGCLMIYVGGMKGLRAILTLFVDGFVILFVMVPLMLKGYNPIVVAWVVSAVLTLSTFVLVTGFNFKVISGVLGTVGALVAVGVLSVISQKVLVLTGMAEEFGFLELGVALWRTDGSHNWNFTGLLTAGVILGAIGAMMDVGMSISSSVYEVKQVNPNITVRQAIRAGLNVGTDIMGTMADTLIFAYLGADIVTMLLPRIDFPEIGKVHPFLQLANHEAGAVIIVQALIGTIGMILTIPIAAMIAGILTRYRKIDRSEIHEKLLSTEEIKAHFQQSSPTGKTRWAVPIALVVIFLGTQYLHNRVNHASATIFEQRDAKGHLISISEYAKGRVIRFLETTPVNEITEHEILEVDMLSGLYKGQRVVLRNIINHSMPLLNIPAKPGDIVLCRVGGTPDEISLVNILQEYGRDGYLLSIFGLMLMLIVIIGRNQGVRTACALITSGLIIYFFMLPLIGQGKEPVLVVVLTCGFIAFSSRFFVIGLGRKTFSATLGTMGGVIVASLIVVIAQHYLHFTGLEQTVSADIIEAAGKPPFDFRGLLLAGMLIGLLGVAMDGAIEVASSMEEIRQANPYMPTWRLIASGMNVGTDILGTMVNTLIFAVLGVRLLLLLAIMSPNLEIFVSPPVELLSIGIAASEILRLLAGTLGLVLTIPLTALVSGFWTRGVKRET
ncbi:YibE/F family protein [Candidatus Poribacteria bacterium]|nr:YibE/F family protein [Candidatus Poribacteria bacterium]